MSIESTQRELAEKAQIRREYEEKTLPLIRERILKLLKSRENRYGGRSASFLELMDLGTEEYEQQFHPDDVDLVVHQLIDEDLIRGNISDDGSHHYYLI